MTCNACVAKVRSELLKLGDISEANVRLESPQATITMLRHIPTHEIQAAVKKAGNYQIAEEDVSMHDHTGENDVSWVQAYKPLLLVAAYITAVTIAIEIGRGSFSAEALMMNFMAGFFLTFSFFKLLDLNGFANSYSTYDIVAKRWHPWGYIYPFVELGLGLAYLLRLAPAVTNLVTFIVMTVSIIGVLQSVLNKRKIQCACLGTVFKLPMSTVTIIEDGLMIVMSAVMLVTIF